MCPDSTTKTIPLSRGMSAIVDSADFDLVSQYNWHANKIGNVFYAVRYDSSSRKNGTQMMHRLIMKPAKGILVDHIDGNGLNCTRANMRLCTKAENGRNRGMNKRNTSGYKGVRWDKERQLWAAALIVNRKTVHLGRYSDPIEAARAYDVGARKHHGEFARLNFPD